MKIKFGTDGWRGIIADDFTFSGVASVTQAIASYLKQNGEQRPVVVGFDCRFLAEQFAARAAEVLTGNGFSVLFTDRPTPTPVIAFVVRQAGAAGALMITASHNPASYCGIKFIPSYAGPATSSITKEIENHLEKNQPPQIMSRAEAVKCHLWQEHEPEEDYFAHLRELVRLHAARRLKVIVDALYGASSGYVDEFLASSGLQVQLLHGERDPLFGGGSPDPTPANLSALAEAVRREGADLGLALDGDGDRLGVIDGMGVFWPVNKVLPLLLYHMIQSRNWQQGEVVRTVATTHMLDSLSNRFGLSVYETPVGFKYVGQRLLRGALFGGEESGGLSVTGHIPEKDAVLSACLVAEMVATRGPLNAFQRQLAQEIRLLESRRWDIRLTQEQKEKLQESTLRYQPGEIAGLTVSGRSEQDGLKLLLEDDSWVLLRISGTEPVARLYVESPEGKRLQQIHDQVTKNLGIVD